MIRIFAFLLALCAAGVCAPGPKLWFSRSFPGSAPAYLEITLDRSGIGQYKEAPEDENPLRFQLSESEVSEIFAIAERLAWFTRQLESPLKVANMGMKTFRFEDGARRTEVKFNYSEDPDARLLLDWFERIAETEQNRITLEQAAKYDKLGVNRALLQLQASLERKRLVAPGQMLPMLDRIAKNETYLHMARLRAADLAEAIRSPAK